MDKTKQKYDPLENLFLRKYGWIIILLLQGIYLTLDVLEVSGVHKVSYGMLASIFMFILGILVLLVSIINIKDKPIHGFIEGGFYIFFSIIIFYYKYQHYLEFQRTQKDLENATKKYDQLKQYTIKLQNINNNLSHNLKKINNI